MRSNSSKNFKHSFQKIKTKHTIDEDDEPNLAFDLNKQAFTRSKFWNKNTQISLNKPRHSELKANQTKNFTNLYKKQVWKKPTWHRVLGSLT